MRRRDFITALGGAAAAWPLAARAQQSTMPVIGFLHPGSAHQFEALATAFRIGLSNLGFVPGRNVLIEYRWADGHYDQLPELAADLVRCKVSAIASVYVQACVAAKTATSTIPIIILTGADPVREGLIPAINRPGGNVTGVTFFAALLGAKRLGLLHDLLPTAGTIAVLANPTNRIVAESYLKDTETAARARRLQIVSLSASSEREIDDSFRTMVDHRVDALWSPRMPSWPAGTIRSLHLLRAMPCRRCTLSAMP
jgi:putative ABC transport system substrate-binding protein